LPRERLHQIVVVDNGSVDGTAQVAREAGVSVVSEPRPGYGRACLAGLAALASLAALDPAVDIVAFMDADHADYPEDLPLVLDPIVRGEADLVIGSRVRHAEPGSLTPQQRAGNRLACALIQRWFRQRYTDLGPCRAIRRDALERLAMRDQAFGWTVEMQAKAARARLRIAEVPVRYRRRIGRSKISGTVTGTILAGTAILSTIVRIAMQSERIGTRRVLLFLKDPQPGRVKTRLAQHIGDEGARQIYRACIELTLARLSPLHNDMVLCVDPPTAASHLSVWGGRTWTTWPQQGSDLGERLAQATARAFAEGARAVIALGSDSPWIAPHDVEAACAALHDADVVLGPTDDGGYYLIGLSRPCPDLFRGIAWGASRVCAQTRETARALGLRTRLLREGYDVDHLTDVGRFVREARQWEPVPDAVEMMDAVSQEAATCRS